MNRKRSQFVERECRCRTPFEDRDAGAIGAAGTNASGGEAGSLEIVDIFKMPASMSLCIKILSVKIIYSGSNSK